MKKIAYFLLPPLVLVAAYFITSLILEQKRYDFIAKSINGQVDMKSFEGKNKIVYFGYTFCPDICPTTLTILGDTLNKLDSNSTIVLFVTLDPQRDNIKDTDEFAKYFYHNSYGLVVQDLDKMVSNYGAKYEKIDLNDSVMRYSVAHSSSIYLFDKKGKFVEEVSNLTYENVYNAVKSLQN